MYMRFFKCYEKAIAFIFKAFSNFNINFATSSVTLTIRENKPCKNTYPNFSIWRN